MKPNTFNDRLFDFLIKTPTSFHTGHVLESMFHRAGYTGLDENAAWTIEPQGRYVIKKNDGAVIAFHAGDMDFAGKGFRMMGAHTDSPGLKIKPRPDVRSASFAQVGVEVYGGPILSTWFDRELSVAGRVSWVSDEKGVLTISSALVDFEKPMVIIPSLAIHLDRDVNNGKSINRQNDLPPLVLLEKEPEFSFRTFLTDHLKSRGFTIPDLAAMDFDLFLYDPQKPACVGLNGDFIVAGRLDNRVSCFCGASALMESQTDLPALFIANDHEEVGSVSTSGAGGSFLTGVLKRLCPEPEQLARTAARSLFVSADNAHGIHPNHKDRYEPAHAPLLNQGPVIKFNAGQRYATDSRSAAALRYLAGRAAVPLQDYVVRSDMACGSTIGPVTSADTGILTVDAGIPMLAMHSIRETAGSVDAELFARLLETHVKTLIF